ncbi:MAG: hypothetical protein JWP59_986, partial [Massilia sp.]|nr:hypothetical protein [Massilia sp.]
MGALLGAPLKLFPFVLGGSMLGRLARRGRTRRGRG